MLTQTLLKLLQRDLAAVRREIEAYPDEPSIWALVPGLPNTGGVLARHLAGNLQHYVGALLGGSGYVRDRDSEFNGAPWPRARLISEIDGTIAVVTKVLPTLTPEQLSRIFPQQIMQMELETADFLAHLAVHCGFHLGQMDYHRRAASRSASSIGPMSIPALASARSPVS
jgi:hypothetical protein